jgi:hypothetical protein
MTNESTWGAADARIPAVAFIPGKIKWAPCFFVLGICYEESVITKKYRKQDGSSLFLELLGTAEQTCPAGGNETDLLTGRRVARNGRSVTNVLVVTTTVRVINGLFVT